MRSTGRRDRAARAARWRLPVAAVLVLAVAACAADKSNDEARPVATRYISFLLGGSSAAEWNKVTAEIESATERAKFECMRSRGFNYRERPVSMRVVFGPELRPTDQEFIQRYGFGVSTTPPTHSNSDKDPNSDAYFALSRAAQDAWNQAEYDCETAAAASTSESLEIDRANDLLGRIDELVLADRGFLEAQLSWKHCVSDAGYDFEGLGWAELAQSVARDWEAADDQRRANFSAHELAIAQSAYECAGPMWKAERSAREAALSQLDDELVGAVFG